jgi:hypothetical protein
MVLFITYWLMVQQGRLAWLLVPHQLKVRWLVQETLRGCWQIQSLSFL